MSHDKVEAFNEKLLSLFQEIPYTNLEFFIEELIKNEKDTYEKNHIAIAKRFKDLGLIYTEKMDILKAKIGYEKALKIYNTFEIDKNTVQEFCSVSVGLAIIYSSIKNYEEAKKIINNFIEISDKYKNSCLVLVDYANIFTILGTVYYSTNDYVKSKINYEKALKVFDEIAEKDSLDFGLLSNNLSILYIKLKEYDKAEEYCNKAKDIIEKLGDDFLLKDTFSNFGMIYYSKNRYLESENFYKKSIKIYKNYGMEYTSEYTACISNLAAVYFAIERFDEAELLYKEVIKIYKDFNSYEYFDLSNILNLALIYINKNEMDQALELYEEAIKINDLHNNLENTSDLILLLNSIGLLNYNLKNYIAAEVKIKKAIDIYYDNFTNNSGEELILHVNLLEIYIELDKLELAREICNKCIGIYENLKSKSYSVMNSASCLSNILVTLENKEKAFSIMMESITFEKRILPQIFKMTSEKERETFLSSLKYKLDKIISFVFTHANNSNYAISNIINEILYHKGKTLEFSLVKNDRYIQNKYPELKDRINHLNNLKIELAQKILSGSEKDNPEDYNETITVLELQKETLEKELDLNVPEIHLIRKLEKADYKSICMEMSENSVLVEIVKYNFYDFSGRHSDDSLWKFQKYGAFILNSEDIDDIKMIDLGEAHIIDTLVFQFISNAIYEIDYKLSNKLREILFDPLVKCLQNKKRIIICPDGELNKLPWESLPMKNKEDGYLIDNYDISYLSTARDILRFNEKSEDISSKPLVIASPDFNLQENNNNNDEKGKSSNFNVSDHINSEDTLFFNDISSIKVGASNIAELLNAVFLSGKQALKSTMKNYKSPYILHIATHGFFFRNAEINPNEKNFFLTTTELCTSRENILKMHHNPMLRSGLALAGANTFLQGGHLQEVAQDGFLTAEEVSCMELSDTELVVLSACETGLGDIKNGEGVFGLRRAFVLAGTKTLIMSLWQVPELTTSILMERFYNNLIVKNLPVNSALKEAQIYIRDMTVKELKKEWHKYTEDEYYAYLKDLSENKKPFTKPFYWGGFICQGKTQVLNFNYIRM